MINFELLDAAIDDAENSAHGYAHKQNNWASVLNMYADAETACGTGMCLAGFTAVREGAEVPRPIHNGSYWSMPLWYVDPKTGKSATPGYGIHVSNFARDRLGLSQPQSVVLFEAANTLEVIRAMREILWRNPDATPADLAAAWGGDDDEV